MTREQKRALIVILTAALLLLGAFFVPVYGWVRAVIFFIPYLIAGFPVLKDAALSLLRGQMMDENFLMSVASLGAFALGEYAEGVAVMLFSRVGALFESYAVGKSRASVAELMRLCPDRATVLRDGSWVCVSPDEVLIGESIRVLPGEKIPMDGIVTQGSSSLDTRSLTGEALPRDICEGDAVLSGCVNLSGVLVIRTEKSFEESTASRILTLVEDSSANRSRSETFVASFARGYTPIVVCVALGVGIIPPLFGGPWSVWLYRALEFLVVSCPCALVISIPLTYFGAIGGASRKGILIKGSDRFEILAKAHTVVLDKTGTLTEGVFAVSSVTGEDPEKVLEIAALCEQFSNHPISQSLRKEYGKPLPEDRVTDVTEMAGYGVSARIDGEKLYFVGNEKWMRRQGISPEDVHTVGTHVFVADEKSCLGVITIADRLRDNAPQAVASLRRLGVHRMVMLTGDEACSAEMAARECGLDSFKARLLPQDKVFSFRKIVAEADGPVVFVGDGMNDAPVLAEAHVGVAMGALGADAAIEAADVVLMRDDLSCLPKVISLAKKTHGIVLQNLVFSIGVKLVIMILCGMGVASMWHAVFADVGVSVAAILNAMRTLGGKN